MPPLSAQLFALALGMTAPWNTGEPEIEYRERLSTISAAFADAPSHYPGWEPKALSAALLVIAYGESRFDPRIHAGEKHPEWPQDGGRARCLGQVHRGTLVSRELWEKSGGHSLESTKACSRSMSNVLDFFRRYCHQDTGPMTEYGMGIIIGAYGTGKGCRSTAQSRKRARQWSRLMRRIR